MAARIDNANGRAHRQRGLTAQRRELHETPTDPDCSSPRHRRSGSAEEAVRLIPDGLPARPRQWWGSGVGRRRGARAGGGVGGVRAAGAAEQQSTARTPRLPAARDL